MCLTCTAEGNTNAALVFAALVDGSARAAEIAADAASIDPDPNASVHDGTVGNSLRAVLAGELTALVTKVAGVGSLTPRHANGDPSVVAIAATIEAVADARHKLLRVIAALDRFGVEYAPAQPESHQIGLTSKAGEEIAQARLAYGGLDVQDVLRSIGAEPQTPPTPGSAIPPNSRAQRRRRVH